MLLLQEPAHIRIPSSLLRAPRPSLQPYFSCLPHLLSFFDRAGKEQQKDTKLERVQQVLPRCWPKMLHTGAKVPAQLFRAVTWAWCFRMGRKALLGFLCYLSPQLSCAKSKSSPGCCTAAHCGWLPRRVSAGGAELPGMPAASCPCLLLGAPQPAGERSMETPQLPGCRMQGYKRDSKMGNQPGECWGTEQELAMSWKHGKLCPLPNNQKLVMDWEIITEE